MKLSVIITAHNEGLLAHKTILSVFRALEDFSEDYEIIVHIDNGTAETKAYFERYADDKRFTILENNFGDLGESRNFAIKRAKGSYVSLLDADDLVSKNYFVQMVKTLDEAEGEIVVHPNYCLSFEDFGDNYVFQTLGESINPEMDAILLFARHRWISAICAKRKTLAKHPYIKTENGYGHEDYTLNIKLTEDKVLHKIAKDTIYFYRRKAVSLLKQSNSQHLTQPYSKMFEIEKWKKFDIPEEKVEQKRNARQVLRDFYIKMRNNKTLNSIITPAAELAKKATGKKIISKTKVPEGVLAEWKEMAKIEMQIFPAQYIIDKMVIYDTDTPQDASKDYLKLCNQIKEMPDYVFIVPWIISGGADKVILNYLKALEELHPEWNIAVIATLQSDNEWKHRMSDHSYLVEFGNVAKNLNAEDRDLLLTRLLIQLRCPKIHIINSVEGLHWVMAHEALVKNEFKISTSLFCPGIIPKTNCEGRWDFADPHVVRIYPMMEKIFTDNTKVVESLISKDGFDKEKLKVHYQPTEIPAHTERHYDSEKALRILWAGRISIQKNPKLLVRIAEKLSPEKVQIDAYGRVDPDELEGFKFPKGSDVLHYQGPFHDFNEIDLEKYDLLLHTSISDGMPNVILEAAAAGMTTIASNVGGISDFVRNGETGFLVDDIENEDEYVKVINEIQTNPSILNKLMTGAEKLLQENYAWEKFVEDVKSDF